MARIDFIFEEKKEQRYTHRNPVTGEWWDDILGKWVKEPEEKKEKTNDQDRKDQCSGN